MAKYELKEIPIEKVYANWFQPRKQFDKEKIKELAESILSNGLINPITVKLWKGEKYLICSGERRWRAHKIAGIKSIQAFVKEYKDDNQFMIESLIENVHREDLGSMDKAHFIKKIWKQMGKPMSPNNHSEPDYKRLGQALSLSRDVLQEHLSLVDISTPTEVKKAVEKGKLAMRSASMISNLPEKRQIAIAKEAIKKDDGMGRSEVTQKIKEHKVLEEYNISPKEAKEQFDKNKKSSEGITLSISLNAKEREATVEACKKEKLVMEYLIKKNHLDWLKKEKYL